MGSVFRVNCKLVGLILSLSLVFAPQRVMAQTVDQLETPQQRANHASVVNYRHCGNVGEGDGFSRIEEGAIASPFYCK